MCDYHLDNYDESGNIRYKPETTTFDLGEEKSGIRYYAPAAELTEDKVIGMASADRLS